MSSCDYDGNLQKRGCAIPFLLCRHEWHDAAPPPALALTIVADAKVAAPLPAPDEVPSAEAFREAFKNAALPRGADSASWAGGYCAGWTAAERAARKPASGDNKKGCA